jgi:hypothetical protein
MRNVYGECVHGNNLATCVKCKFGDVAINSILNSVEFPDAKIIASNDAMYLIDLYKKENSPEVRSFIATRIVELKKAMTEVEVKEFDNYALPMKFFVAPKKYIL